MRAPLNPLIHQSGSLVAIALHHLALKLTLYCIFDNYFGVWKQQRSTHLSISSTIFVIAKTLIGSRGRSQGGGRGGPGRCRDL